MLINPPLIQPSVVQNPPSQQLPPGWTYSYDPQGRLYFINHNSRVTNYQDPRIPSLLKFEIFSWVVCILYKTKEGIII